MCTITQLKTPIFVVTWTLIVLRYEVNNDILLFILAPGYKVSTWGCVVLTVYDSNCQIHR